MFSKKENGKTKFQKRRKHLNAIKLHDLFVFLSQSPVLKSKVPHSAYAEGSTLQASQTELSIAGRRMGVIFLDFGTGLSAYIEY